MRIAILGSGAMGTVMGAYFAKNGLDPELIDNYQAHVDAMREKGARVTGCADFTVPVNAYTTDEMSGVYDLVFLFTKQLANAELLPRLTKHLGPDSTVCTLQNGVPEPFVAQYVGEKRTVGGTVLWGATFVEPGVSELTQDITKTGVLFDVGEISGEITPRIKAVAQVLEKMGPVLITDKLMAARWGKLVNNACMSGMSAVCGATFGEVRADPKARACLSYLGREVKACCDAEGYAMPDLLGGISPECLSFNSAGGFADSQRAFWDMYKELQSAKASMLQDLEKGRPTEVGMINGYVCQTGRRLGIPTPFNDRVVEIVGRIERGTLTCSMENLSLFEPEWFEYDFIDI
ncbi:MAG: 2-dehydropantoate 2-reductase [Oscillospiraceae bacterium]|jgi:2-dehydropantoate 2-reductase|nr:2-dehydropantoate 2-reductase [Oscillospiraceae bacterium]